MLINPQVDSLARSLLKAIGGILVYAGVTDDGTIELTIGALMTVAGLVWSFTNHKENMP